MNSAIQILLKLVVAADQEAAWRSLMTEMISSTETEPCTVLYEWYADAARGTWHIHDAMPTAMPATRMSMASLPISGNGFSAWPSRSMSRSMAILAPRCEKSSLVSDPPILS